MAKNRKSKRMRKANKRSAGIKHGTASKRQKFGFKSLSDGTEIKVKL